MIIITATLPRPTLCRLLLAHQGEPDRWAAHLGRYGLRPAQQRAVARALAVEGDTLGARLVLLSGDKYTPTCPQKNDVAGR